MDFKKHPQRLTRHLISMPFIYMMIIPIVILDIFLEVYHRICFPLYGLTYLKRSNYIRIDRQKLSYLATLEKINCSYCGYANGLAHYFSAIAAQTEKYWCGIKHSETKGFKSREHHKDFLKFGDEKAYKRKYAELKKNKENAN